MQLRTGSKITAGAAASWLALGAVVSARLLVAAVPARLVAALAGASLVASAAAALLTFAAVWRGPVIVSFRRREAVLCDPIDADAVRAGAQLRGTMGGAGHVHPGRLALPSLAWAAAALLAARIAADPSLATVPAWPAIAALATALAAALLPARSFFYREVIGGCVLVHPPGACIRLLDSRAAGAAPPRERPASAPDRWVNSRNDVEPCRGSPHADAPQPR